MNAFKKFKVSDKGVPKQLFSVQLPIIWLMGPSNCGKTTLGKMLANCSKYYLIRTSELLMRETESGNLRGRNIQSYLDQRKEIPTEIVVALLKETILNTYVGQIGYIIENYPLHLKQARHFEKLIYKPSLVIYATLKLEAFLTRLIGKYGAINLNRQRILHIKQTRRFKKLFANYENIAVQVYCCYPPEDTVTRLITELEDSFGFKFERLYNK